MGDGAHIELFHLDKLRNSFNTVLESEYCILCCVTKSARQKRLVFREICSKFITEMETLMELYFSLYICGKHGYG